MAFYYTESYLKLRSRCIHVRNHGAHVTDNGSENEHSNQKVDHHKGVLKVRLRNGHLANSCQRQS